MPRWRDLQAAPATRNVCRIIEICSFFLPQPTSRTLRLLSCHPRLATPRSLPATLQPALNFDGLRRNAIAIIGTAPRRIAAQTAPLLRGTRGAATALDAPFNEQTKRSVGVDKASPQHAPIEKLAGREEWCCDGPNGEGLGQRNKFGMFTPPWSTPEEPSRSPRIAGSARSIGRRTTRPTASS